MINLEQAKLDPGSVFEHPHDVLNAAELSKEDKIDILRRWAYDEQELLMAEEENMPSTHPTDNMEEIIIALQQLSATLQDC